MDTQRAAADPDGVERRAQARLAAAQEMLDELPDRPVTEHVAAFDAVHRQLQDALAALDDA